MASSSSSSTSLLSFSLLLLFSLLPFSAARPLTKATGILSDSGYSSMSFALSIASHSLTSLPPSLTVFAPADAAFTSTSSGRLTLNLLRHHLLPLRYNLRSLKSLPPGAKIPTLLAGHSLTVTTDSDLVSLNNVTLTSPIFDDASLIIYGTNSFFDPFFQISDPIRIYGSKIDFRCVNPKTEAAAETAARYSFGEASKVLISKGCSVMAAFLEMQLLTYQTALTVFAPVDAAVANRIGDLSQYASLFRRHVVPCKLSWTDLASLEEGTTVLLRTNLQGFRISLTRNDGVLVLNGVSVVILPEIYRSDWLVVHGISEVLEFPASLPEQVVVSSPESEAVEIDENPDGTPRTEPADDVMQVPSLPEFDGGDSEEFEGGESELFGNMTEDEDAVSHRRFFVYRPS